MINSAILEIIGQIGIAVALIVLGVLSKRLGDATRAKPHYIGFFFAATLMVIAIIMRSLNLFFGWVALDQVHFSTEWVIVYNGLPAIAITIGVVFGWHYWSWLLAEQG